MKDRMKKLDRTDDESVSEEIDKRVVELEAARVLDTTWIHVDMDGKYILRILGSEFFKQNIFCLIFHT